MQDVNGGAGCWVCWISLDSTQTTVLRLNQFAVHKFLHLYSLTQATVCYFNISRDDILNENFEKSCANIEALSFAMVKAFDLDDWPALLKLNKEMDVLLQSVGIDKLTEDQKVQYKHVLESFYKTHRLTLQKCSESYKDTEAELGLLRKQQSAGNIYQQIQDGQ